MQGFDTRGRQARGQRRAVAAALNPRREVERLPHGHLRDMAAVLIHVSRGARHHELIELVAVERDVAVDLRSAYVI